MNGQQLLLFILLDSVGLASSTICRDNRSLLPHQNGLWNGDFPIEDNDAIALCEGTITVQDSGEICIDGRVSYGQLADAIDKPIFAPASRTISVTGHLITGSGNLVLGSEAKFVQDFITKVTVDGQEYIVANNHTSTSGKFDTNVFSKSSSFENSTTTVAGNLTDTLLGASRGTIDGVCFSSDIAQDNSYYKISQKSWAPGNVDKSEIENANFIYGSKFRVVAEYNEVTDAPLISANPLMTFFNLILSSPTPAILYSYIPILGFSGILRQALVFGTMSTQKHPQPLIGPDLDVNIIQVDVEWSVLITAIENGLFEQWPLYGGAIIKRISASNKSCWSAEDTASFDLQFPLNQGEVVDDFVDNILYPILTDLGGTVSLHFGKRIPQNSDTLQSALNFYEDCGVEVGLDLDPEDCFHPMCNRGLSADTFTYPPQYFEFIDRFPGNLLD